VSKRIVGKLGVVALVAAVGVAAAALGGKSAHAEHGGTPRFDNRDLRGNYGFLETGPALGQNWYEVGIISADGRGKATVQFIGTLGGHTSIVGNLTCKYDVKVNGMGSMHCTDNQTEDTSIEFVLMSGGDELNFVTAPNPTFHVFGTAKRQ
jgi:hypothetical protein